MRKLCLLVLGAAFFFSCSQPAGTTDPAGVFNLDSVKAAIEENNAVLIKAIKTGDSAAFVSCYTKDACMMGNNMPKLCGLTGLGQFLTGARNGGIENLKLAVTEVIGDKSLISEEGVFEIIANDGSSIDKGKYIVIWKQEDGKWKKYRDIFNSDMPPAPAVPAKK